MEQVSENRIPQSYSDTVLIVFEHHHTEGYCQLEVSVSSPEDMMVLRTAVDIATVVKMTCDPAFLSGYYMVQAPKPKLPTIENLPEAECTTDTRCISFLPDSANSLYADVMRGYCEDEKLNWKIFEVHLPFDQLRS